MEMDNKLSHMDTDKIKLWESGRVGDVIVVAADGKDRFDRALFGAVVVITALFTAIVLLSPAPLPLRVKLPAAFPAHRTLTDIQDPGIFIDPQVEAEYPGGTSAWHRYLAKNVHYPDSAVGKDIEGIVRVQFVVNEDGHVSDVKAISGPVSGGLRAEAVRVIVKSSKWTPAHGINPRHPIRSYKVQPVVFRLKP